MRKRPRPDRIAAILRDIQADLQAGLKIIQACRKGGVRTAWVLNAPPGSE